MHGLLKQWNPGAGGAAGVRRWAAALAIGAVMWLHPGNSITEAIFWIAGLYAIWNWRTTLSVWNNPVGILFGAGVSWALLSIGWSFNPSGTASDLLAAVPLVLSTLAIPVIFQSSSRIWGALLVSAGWVTAGIGLDLIRLLKALGWPGMLTEARFFHPYLYTHPNVSSMMAGLCVLVLLARWVAGAPGWMRKYLLAAGIALNLIYLVVMASRGPQLVFALILLIFPLVLLPGWRSRLAAAVLLVMLGCGFWKAAVIVNPRFQDQTMGNLNTRDTVWGHSKLLADRKPLAGYGFGKQVFESAVYDNPDQRPPLVPFRYPHAHQYWLMLYFQGGVIGFSLISLGWLALWIRLIRREHLAECLALDWRGRLGARVLPALLGTGILFILVYGLGDYPDQVIRRAQFHLLGLAVAWTGLPLLRKEGDG